MNVVGYDCEGKPLSPGDRVVIIACKAKFRHLIGQVFTVDGKAHPLVLTLYGPNRIGLAERIPELPDRPIHIKGGDVRKINGERPEASDLSFHELIGSIKHTEEPTEV